MFNDFDEHYKFNVFCDVSFPNAKYIHPLKQRDLQKIYNQLVVNENVLFVAIFGSTVDFRCNSYSDIDLYIELKDVSRPVKFDYNFQSEIDVIYNIEDKSQKMWEEIERVGIIILDRRVNCV